MSATSLGAGCGGVRPIASDNDAKLRVLRTAAQQPLAAGHLGPTRSRSVAMADGRRRSHGGQ